MIKFTVADNSHTRRNSDICVIWRNNIDGLFRGNRVEVTFKDEFTKAMPRTYIIDDIFFADDFSRSIGRHSVKLRRAKED